MSFGYLIRSAEGLYYLQRIDIDEARWVANPLEAAHFTSRSAALRNAEIYAGATVVEHKLEDIK